MKLEALLASAGTLALTWRCARERGFDPVAAILVVGANPLYVIYGLGGAHNDLIMMLAMMAAVSLTIDRQADRAPGSRGSGAGRRRRAREGDRRGAAPVHDRLAASPGADPRRRGRRRAGRADRLRRLRQRTGIDVVAALNRDAAFVSSDSFATEIAHLFGKPGVFPVDHDLLKAALVLIMPAPAVADLARL